MSDAKIAVKVQVLLSGRAPHYRRLVAATFTDVREAIARMYHRDAGDLIFEYRDEEGDLVQFDTDFEWEALVTQQQQARVMGTHALDASMSGSPIVRIVVRSSDMEGPALLAAQQALASMSSVAPSMSTFFEGDVSGVIPSLSAPRAAPQAVPTPSRSPSTVIGAPAPSPVAAPAAAAPAAPDVTARPPAAAGFTKRCPMCHAALQLHASPSWRCDLCSHRAARDGTETSLACRHCDFDLCLDCNNRLDAAATTGDASMPPPPLARGPGAGGRWAANPVGALLHTMRDLVVGAHSHRHGTGGQDDSSLDATAETPVLPTLDAATQPAASTQDATTQGATPVTADATTRGATPVTADATTQGSAVTVDATTHAAAPVTVDATTHAAAPVTVDATTQRAAAAAAATTHAETTMTADATTVTTVEPAVTADSATETGDHLVTPPTSESPSATEAEAARGAHLTLSPTLRTALRDLIPLLSLVYNTDAERAITTCDAGLFRGAIRIQCNRGAGTVAYTLQDDQFVEHAFSRMVELVRLAAATPTTAAVAPATESLEAAALAAASAAPVPEHPLATAEEIAAGICNFYPALPAAHYNYAIILVKRNKAVQALSELEAAVDLGISPAVAHSDADLVLLHREVRFRLLGAAPAPPEVKALLELFGDLSVADARAALARYGTVHRAADALLASDGVLPPEPAPHPAGPGPYQGPLHGGQQHHAPAAPPPRPATGFHPLSGFPGFGGRR